MIVETIQRFDLINPTDMLFSFIQHDPLLISQQKQPDCCLATIIKEASVRFFAYNSTSHEKRQSHVLL